LWMAIGCVADGMGPLANLRQLQTEHYRPRAGRVLLQLYIPVS
jgi:hypothetical protein